MNRSVLSVEEIAALAEGFSDGDGPTPQPPADARLRVNGLPAGRIAIPGASAMPGGPVQGALKDLDLIHEGFAIGLGSTLSYLMKREVGIIAHATQASNCQDWAAGLRRPQLAYAMRIHGGGSACLLVFEEDWLRSSLDLLLGGTGNVDGIEWRGDFSPVESVFGSRMAALACQVYGRAWKGITANRVKSSHCEHQGGIHAYAMPDAALVCGKFQLCADSIKGSAWIVFPMALLGPIIGRSNAARSRSTGAEKFANRRV